MTQSTIPTTQAKRFTLSDRDSKTKINFFPQSPGPVRPGKDSQLNYQGPEGGFTFRGEEITQQQSRIGLLITVTLQSDAADAGEIALTLVLPPVNLAGKKAQELETIAIKTRSFGFVVDRSGAQLKYEVLSLKGFAQAVILPFSSQDSESNASQRRVDVREVKLELLESNPPQLQIHCPWDCSYSRLDESSVGTCYLCTSTSRLHL